jgi:hypothetical protein
MRNDMGNRTVYVKNLRRFARIDAADGSSHLVNLDAIASVAFGSAGGALNLLDGEKISLDHRQAEAISELLDGFLIPPPDALTDEVAGVIPPPDNSAR